MAGALLGWRAEEFWQATPAELAAVVRALVGDGGAMADGGDLQRLMGMFPDNPGTPSDRAESDRGN